MTAAHILEVSQGKKVKFMLLRCNYMLLLIYLYSAYSAFDKIEIISQANKTQLNLK